MLAFHSEAFLISQARLGVECGFFCIVSLPDDKALIADRVGGVNALVA